jgi:methyl-accepting chemotaxis protein
MGKKSLKSRKDKGLSIGVKWVLFICISMMLAIGATVLFNHFTVSKILKEDNVTSGKNNANNAAKQVTLSLQNYEDSIEQLASLVSTDIKEKDSIARVEKSVQAVEKESDRLLAVYYMDFTTGKIHISPHAELDIDVRDTRTYDQLKENTETQWMDVYQDKLSDKIMTSVVTPIVSDGKMVGALGYDIDLSTIGAMREEIEKETNTNLVILDAQGFIISSFMKDADGKNINPAKSGSVEGVEDLITNKKDFNSKFDWIEEIYTNSEDVSHDLTWEGKDYSGQITTIPELNWKVLSFTPDEIFTTKMDQFKTTGWLSILLGLVIGILCAVYLARKLKKLIAKFQEVIGKTAEGDLTTELIIDSKDEIGELANRYNEMLQNMRSLVEKVLGNAHSINQSTSGLTIIAKENSSAVSEVSRSIEEIAVGANNQSEEIEKGSEAAHELSSEIEKLLIQSTGIESEVGEASEKLKTGNRQVENLEESYLNLEKSFEKVTEMISKLDEKSKSVSDVTNTIAQIAEQTNLLSLNASIEAARAGEHGKGFSVVANEVRNLAEESKQATNDIQQIIISVLNDTKELVKVMAETNQISVEQKGAVTKVSSSIDQLNASLTKMMSSLKEETTSINSVQRQKDIVVKMIEEISAVSQQTTASSEEIASAMEEQAASTNEVAQHTTQLSNLIEDLNKAIEKFQINK